MIKIVPHYKNKQVEAQLKNITWDMHKGIRSALYEIGAENTQQTKKFIYGPPKTGRFYPYKGRLHQASAPGQSPAKMSGFLARSLNYRVVGTIKVEFYSSAIYSNVLEDGHKFKDGREIKPRPYFIRTIRKKRGDNYNSLQRHVYARIKP